MSRKILASFEMEHTSATRLSVHFSPFQQGQIQEPRLVDFTEIDFLMMVCDELEDIFLSDAMDVPAIPVVPACALKAIA